MGKIENAVLAVTLGAVPIIASFLLGWWGSIPFVPESSIWQFALAGLLLGILVDVLFLRRWLRQAYALKPWVWKALYVFYSIGILGLFMGFPLFNLVLAVPAGLFAGRWLARQPVDLARLQRTVRQAAAFTTVVLAAVCAASGSIALLASSTASDVQRMLALPFPVTRLMILGVIVIGGTAMLMVDWWVTAKCVRSAYKYFRAREGLQMA